MTGKKRKKKGAVSQKNEAQELTLLQKYLRT
jgi:hypothetical protein